MRRLGLILSGVGALGLLVTALSFAADYQPMWIHAVKGLPDKGSFTHQEVAAAVIQHIESTRAHFYLGVLCSALQIANVFDDFRRSTAVMQLAIMRRLDLLTDEELSLFSEQTRRQVEGIASL